jgi:hypothetical protein
MPDIPTLVSESIAAASAGIRLIDQMADQVMWFLSRRKRGVDPPAWATERQWRYQVQEENGALVTRQDGRELQTITAADFEKLPEAQLRHIQVLEKSMEGHYRVWAAVYPKLATMVDPVAEARVEAQLEDVIQKMRGDFVGILDFFQSIGLNLDDHYMHVRSLVENA